MSGFRREDVAEGLDTRVVGRAVHHLETTTSTNDVVLRLAGEGAPEGVAVFAEERLKDEGMADIPTAKEQGYDIVWPVVRGFYVGPKVSDEDYQFWKASFDKLLASEDFAKLRDQRELFPFAMTGPELDAYVKQQVAQYKQLAREFGLIQ